MLPLFVALLAPVLAAQREPQIGYVHPAGGQRGTEVEVTVGGQALVGVSGAFVSGASIRAELVSYERPLTQKELNDLREKAAELQRRREGARRQPTGEAASRPESRAWTPDDEKLLAEIRRKLADRARRDLVPAIAETALLRITIASDAEPGTRDLRLVTPLGLTNPLVFCVGELEEAREPSQPPAPVGPAGRGLRDATRPGAQPLRIEIPCVANGQILPGEVDRLRFAARKGQRLVARVQARALIPYLADAVPGWFQPIVVLRDAQGRELACVDDYRFDPDPVLLHQIPADGDYVLEIRDALYRGREDFVYRVALGELPFLTSVFPLGAPGTTDPVSGPAKTPAARVALRGWNLPVHELSVGAEATGVQVRAGRVSSNVLPFARDTLAELPEQEKNDVPATAQALEGTCIVNGRIDWQGDVDVFRFEGLAGQQVVAEVLARRLRSPLDSALRLTDAAGMCLATADDQEDAAEGLETHHADARLRATLPGDGTFYLHLRDAQAHGGPDHAYRLRFGLPRPDFELRVVPSCLNVRAGSPVAFTAHASRRDGFDGEIALALRDAPPGWRLDGARIPKGQDRVRLTLSVPGPARAEPVRLEIEGRVTIGGREIARAAVPADDRMQAFAYRHLVAAQDLLACVLPGAGLQARVVANTPVAIPLGGEARVRFSVARPGQRARAQDRGQELGPGAFAFELDDPPPGITLASFAPVAGGFELVLRAEAVASKKDPDAPVLGSASPPAATPVAGNLIVRITASGATRPGAPARDGARRRLGVLPAIPFVVAPKGSSDGGD